MMFLTMFLKCRLIKQSGKDMGRHPYTSNSLSLLSYKVSGVLRVYARNLSSDLDEEDILRGYVRNLFIDLKDERDTSSKKHDQR
jgi:hypothetical protein